MRVCLTPIDQRLWLYAALTVFATVGRQLAELATEPRHGMILACTIAASTGALIHTWIRTRPRLQPWFARRVRLRHERHTAHALIDALDHCRLETPAVTVDTLDVGHSATIAIPPGRTRDDVHAQLPAIREQLGLQAVTVDDRTRPAPGTVTVLLIADDALAQPLACPAPVIDGWAPHRGAYTWIPVGLDAAGRTIAFPLATREGGGRRFLIGGASGSGKNSFFTQMLLGAVTMGADQAHLWLADLKGTEFAPFAAWADRYETNASTVVAMLDDLTTEMQRRQVRLREAGRNTWDVDSDGPLIVAVIDELTVITNNADPALTKRGERALVQLASLSRSVGISLMVALQTPNVDYIPSAARNNFDDRIAFRVVNDAAAEVIIPGVTKLPDVNPAAIYDEIDSDTGISLSAGICAAEGVNGRARLMRCWYTPLPEVRTRLTALPAPPFTRARAADDDGRDRAGHKTRSAVATEGRSDGATNRASTGRPRRRHRRQPSFMPQAPPKVAGP